MRGDNPYEIVLLVVSWALLVTLSAVAVGRDERKSSEERLERAWPPASRDSALIGLSMLGAPLLGLFAVVFNFWRTRRWAAAGLLLGLAYVAGIILVNGLVTTALAWTLGLPLE